MALRNAINLRLEAFHAQAIEDRAARGATTASRAARELLSLGVVIDAAETSGLAVTGAARALMADSVGMANVQFGWGLEPAELATIAGDLSDQEHDAIEGGAPVLMTVEQMRGLPS